MPKNLHATSASESLEVIYSGHQFSPTRCSTRGQRLPRRSATHLTCTAFCRPASERSRSRRLAACRFCAASRPTSSAMRSCEICRTPTKRCSLPCSFRNLEELLPIVYTPTVGPAASNSADCSESRAVFF